MDAIPLVIYRVQPEEAYQLGILGQTVEQLGDLRAYAAMPQEGTALPKPLAALSNAAGIAQSRKEACLWLLHPQLGELQPYLGRPPLLALKSSYGFYEAYLPHSSSAVPHEWYSQEQLCKLLQHKDLAAPWLGSEEKQGLLGIVLKHFYFWKKLGRSLLRSMPSELKEAEQLLQKAHSGTAVLQKLPLKKPGSKLWLAEAQAAEQRRSAAPESLARSLWALLAFWASSPLRPEPVLRRLSHWLRVELQHQELFAKMEIETQESQAKAPNKDQAKAPNKAKHPELEAWRSALR